MRRRPLLVDLPENRGSVIYRLPNPSQKTSGGSALNWVGKRKFSPWENANGNTSIFRGSKSPRPCTEVARCQPVANFRRS